MNWSDKFRDISQLGSATLLATMLTMVEGVVAAKVLGPAVIGAWFTFHIVLRYGGRLHLGVPNAFRRQLSVERGAGKERSVHRLADTVATFLLLVIGVQLILISGIHLWPGFSRDLRYIALFGVIIAAFQTGRSFVMPYYNGVGNFGGNAVLKLIKSGAIVLTIGLTLQYGLTGFLIGRVLREVIPFAFGFHRIGYVPSLSLDRDQIQRLMRIGFLIMIVSFSSQILRTVDRLTIVAFFSQEGLGYYGTGDTFATIVLTVSSVIMNVLYTSFSEKFGAEESFATFRAEIVETVKVLSYFFPIVFVNIYLFVPIVIRTLLPEYSASIAVGRSLAFGYVFFACASVVGSVLHSFNEQRLYVAVIAFGTAVNALLNYVVIHFGGALYGISVATAVAYFIYFILVIGVVLAYFDASTWLIARSVAQVLVPALVALAYVVLLSELIDPTAVSLSLSSALPVIGALTAALPLSLAFGLLTLRESEIDLSFVRSKIREMN